MKQQNDKNKMNTGKQKKFKLFKPRKKKSVEEDAAIQYLQSQYDKVRMFSDFFSILLYFNFKTIS